MAKQQKLTAKQRAMKLHKASQRSGYPKCGAYIDPNERERVIKRDWRGVTCKNCLKQKK